MDNLRPIRVFVVDDHRLMVEAVRLVLERESGFELVGDAGSGARIVSAVGAARPDCVVLDVRMPGVDGLTALARLREHLPEVKVVVLSALDDPTLRTRAIEAGAVAYVPKTADPETLVSTLRTVVAFGRAADEPPATDEETEDDWGLTPREREVLAYVAAGESNSAVARRLWVSEQTVKYHLTNIYRKLGVKNRVGGVRFALEHGLVRPGEPVR